MARSAARRLSSVASQSASASGERSLRRSAGAPEYPASNASSGYRSKYASAYRSATASERPCDPESLAGAADIAPRPPRMGRVPGARGHG
jgi:hypothetical protein